MPPNPTTPDELIAYLTIRAGHVRELSTLVDACHSEGIDCPTLESLLNNTLHDTEAAATACLASLAS